MLRPFLLSQFSKLKREWRDRAVEIDETIWSKNTSMGRCERVFKGNWMLRQFVRQSEGSIDVSTRILSKHNAFPPHLSTASTLPSPLYQAVLGFSMRFPHGLLAQWPYRTDVSCRPMKSMFRSWVNSRFGREITCLGSRRRTEIPVALVFSAAMIRSTYVRHVNAIKRWSYRGNYFVWRTPSINFRGTPADCNLDTTQTYLSIRMHSCLRTESLSLSIDDFLSP